MITRRSFVKLSAITGVAALSGTALAACSKPASSNAGSGDTAEFDLVIVGSGAGGLGAALKANELGKSVVVLEKEAGVGGDTALSAGTIHAPGTKLQEEQGFGGDTVETYIAYMSNPDSPFATSKHPLCETLYAGAVEMVDDLSAQGLPFLPIEDWDIRAHNVDGGGGALIRFLSDKADKAGIDVRTKTAADSLILEEGKVVGILDDKGNEYIGKAVLLATGGFTNSADMIQKYMPEFSDIRVLCSAGAEGDGLDMATDIGAAAWNLDLGLHTYFVSTESTTDMSVPPASAPGIIVNIEGVRFHNEDAHYDVAGKKGIEQPEHRAYYVFDQTVRDGYDFFQDYFDEGIVIEASSLEDLAEKINTPHLVETVEHYNEMMAEGVDSDFGRETYLAKLTGPKFYAMSIEPCVYYSYGGLEIDEKAHVLDENGQAIPGLYACGEVCASSELKEGLNYTSGISQGYVFGRIAVETAADELGF